MSAVAQKESLVKESLFQFVTKYIPTADLSVIDDIVLSYVISIVEVAPQETGFDVQAFTDMMTALIPEFSVIDNGVVFTWLFDLDEKLTSGSKDYKGNLDCDQKMSLTLQNIREMLPTATDKRTTSESSEEAASIASSNASVASYTDPEVGKAQDILQDMFPNTCLLEIKHCLSIARGDVDLATATLLHRRESGQALTSKRASVPSQHRATEMDDTQVKNQIIERYSYVDEAPTAKEHRPVAPKDEPKKLVRYRDNKIVSLKGERYTEVSKSGAEENLKKPKKPHCP